MGDTIQQSIGSLSAGSPEFKRALKVLIKYEIHCLLQRLSDTGEEAILITTSVEDGIQEHLGTSKGEGFLQHVHTLTQLKEQFRQYCTDELVLSEENSPGISRSVGNSPGLTSSVVEERKCNSENGATGATIEDRTVEIKESEDMAMKGVEAPPKPVDFSWKMERITDRMENTGKGKSLCTPPDNDKLDHKFNHPAYLFGMGIMNIKQEYEESEVQDLSIHQRRSSSDKPGTSVLSPCKRKRKFAKSSHVEQTALPNNSDDSDRDSVLPRCQFDLSVSQLVENLSKAAHDKWTEENTEQADRLNNSDKAVDQRVPVYFKCTDSPVLSKSGEPVHSKNRSVTYSESKEALSWKRDSTDSSHVQPAGFESWGPISLKKENTDSSDNYTSAEGKDECYEEMPHIKSEIKTEPEYGDAVTSGGDKSNSSINTSKYSNMSATHGASPIQLNFICKICGQNFRNRQYRDFHVKMHKSSHSFLCNLCSAGFNTEEECNNHQKLHTEPIFRCDNCGYRCTREFRMRAHKEICGEPAKIYKCPFCDKQFAAQRYMRIHMKSHDTKNVHTCPYCQNTYPLKNSLLKHIKKKHNHQGALKFEIPIGPGQAELPPTGF